MTVNREQALNWARFVATKFYGPDDPWIYSRNNGNLKHIRYESDYTGNNHWIKRLKRAFAAWNPSTYFGSKTIFSKMITDKSIQGYFIHALAYSKVALEKENNLPDGKLSSGVITFWEEDGEYIMFFGPTVGVKVLDFIKDEPDNPHAIAIVDEMIRVVNLSYPGEDSEDDDT